MTEPIKQPELFVVRHYGDDERPIIKGNGFDGLTIGEDREEAEQFVAWVNARLAVEQATAELRAEVERLREALEDLVTLCNTDFVLAADPVVIAAEAALERLYRARTALARKEPDHA
jgi:hypothetical protein